MKIYYSTTITDRDYLDTEWGPKKALNYLNGEFLTSWNLTAPSQGGVYYWQAEILLNRFNGILDGSGNTYDGYLFFPCRAYGEPLRTLTVNGSGTIGIIINSTGGKRY